jgi:hypothetical protein
MAPLGRQRHDELLRQLRRDPSLVGWLLPRLRKRVGKPPHKPETVLRMYGDQVDTLLRDGSPLTHGVTYGSHESDIDRFPLF